MSAEINPLILLAVAEKAARRSAGMITRAMTTHLKVNEATQHDIKLQLDVDSQKLITETFRAHFPDHALLGEEGEHRDADLSPDQYEWIIDPIDGTVNLAYGIPHFCISIACRRGEEILAGVVMDPMRNECFTASKGGGAFCNGLPMYVSKRTRLDEAIMALGYGSAEAIPKYLELFTYYVHQLRKIRLMGAAALDMAYIASGRIDAYIEQGVKIWDIAAGKILVEEAGGKCILTPLEKRFQYHLQASNGLLSLPVV